MAMLAALVVAVVVAGVTWYALGSPSSVASWRSGPGPRAEDAASPSPVAPTTPPPPPMPTLAAPADPSSITAEARLFGWALLDRRSGVVSGSANSDSAMNTVESMIKPWIAADWLRRKADAGQQPTEAQLNELTLMIVDSNDPLAEKYYRDGGSDAVVERMISTCQLQHVKIKTTLWSWTEMTPQDTVRYGVCLGDGRAAGPQWTTWLLDTMRQVRGTVAEQKSGTVQGGRWGIIDGLPPELAQTTSIKNGWTSYKDGWHVNCLAVHEDWTLGIMIRSTRGLSAAAQICQQVAESLVINP